MPVGITFRVALQDDAKRIADLINVAYRGDEGVAGWTHEMHLVDGPRTSEVAIIKLIDESDSRILLCVQSNEIIGSVLVQRQGDAAYLGMLAVPPHLQGVGIGKSLLLAAEKFVQREWSTRKITMNAIIQRPELIKFYTRRGYEMTGRFLPFPEEAAARVKIGDIKFAMLEKNLTSVEY